MKKMNSSVYHVAIAAVITLVKTNVAICLCVIAILAIILICFIYAHRKFR